MAIIKKKCLHEEKDLEAHKNIYLLRTVPLVGTAWKTMSVQIQILSISLAIPIHIFL